MSVWDAIIDVAPIVGAFLSGAVLVYGYRTHQLQRDMHRRQVEAETPTCDLQRPEYYHVHGAYRAIIHLGNPTARAVALHAIKVHEPRDAKIAGVVRLNDAGDVDSVDGFTRPATERELEVPPHSSERTEIWLRVPPDTKRVYGEAIVTVAGEEKTLLFSRALAV